MDWSSSKKCPNTISWFEIPSRCQKTCNYFLSYRTVFKITNYFPNLILMHEIPEKHWNQKFVYSCIFRHINCPISDCSAIFEPWSGRWQEPIYSWKTPYRCHMQIHCFRLTYCSIIRSLTGKTIWRRESSEPYVSLIMLTYLIYPPYLCERNSVCSYLTDLSYRIRSFRPKMYTKNGLPQESAPILVWSFL